MIRLITWLRLWAEGIWAILTGNEMRLTIVAKEMTQRWNAR